MNLQRLNTHHPSAQHFAHTGDILELFFVTHTHLGRPPMHRKAFPNCDLEIVFPGLISLFGRGHCVGFMDNIIRKAELKNNSRLVDLLNQAALHVPGAPAGAWSTGTVPCGEQPTKWTHQSIEYRAVNGIEFSLHRCRNVWFGNSGSIDAYRIMPVKLTGGDKAHLFFLFNSALDVEEIVSAGLDDLEIDREVEKKLTRNRFWDAGLGDT